MCARVKAWLCQGSRFWLKCDVTRRQRLMRALVSFTLKRKLRTIMRRTLLLGYSSQPVAYPVDRHLWFYIPPPQTQVEKTNQKNRDFRIWCIGWARCKNLNTLLVLHKHTVKLGLIKCNKYFFRSLKFCNLLTYQLSSNCYFWC